MDNSRGANPPSIAESHIRALHAPIEVARSDNLAELKDIPRSEQDQFRRNDALESKFAPKHENTPHQPASNTRSPSEKQHQALATRNAKLEPINSGRMRPQPSRLTRLSSFFKSREIETETDVEKLNHKLDKTIKVYHGI
jgi:hypothetical protein